MTVDNIEYEESIDLLKLFFHKEFPITDGITLFQPSMQDIIDYEDGESAFLFVLYIFVGNTTHFKVLLWDNGVDWNKISDFEMFCDSVTSLSVNQTKIFFGDLDFSKFQVISKTVENNEEKDGEDNEPSVEKVLYDPINNIEITEFTYLRIRSYLRHMFGIFPNIEVGIKSERMKKEIIEYDRKKANKSAAKSSSSYYLPLISACLNHPGFKYKSSELCEIGVVEFLDSVERLPIYEHCKATLNGMLGGFVDGTKVDPESYNFFRDIYVGRHSKTAQERVEEVKKETSNS